MSIGLETNRKLVITIVIVLVTVAMITVIAIVGAVIALPMAQQAREAARREQAKNHLKQIGLALQNYASNNTVLPTSKPEPSTIEE